MLTLIVALGMLPGCYVLKMGWSHQKLMSSRRPLDEVIVDPGTPPHVRERLTLVREILGFATVAGLNVGEAYRSYVHLDRDFVSCLVQVAPVDRLELKTWWFPIVGSVPYRGYFAEEECRAEADRYPRDEFDVVINHATAFSTLGWFDDPVTRPMLSRQVSRLSHVLFHELTHRTLWIRGSVEVNEQVAEFVGTTLTREFLRKSGRPDELAAYEVELKDVAKYEAWVAALRNELAQLYDRGAALGREVILRVKKETIESYLGVAKRPQFSRGDWVSKRVWNNAALGGVALYTDDPHLTVLYKCMKSPRIGEFLAQLEQWISEFQTTKQAAETKCGFRQATVLAFGRRHVD